MKKTALVWLLALSMALFVGCGKKDENVNAPVDQQQIENQQQQDANQPTDAPAPTDNTATGTENNEQQSADQTNADITDATDATDGADVNDANAPTDKE